MMHSCMNLPHGVKDTRAETIFGLCFTVVRATRCLGIKTLKMESQQPMFALSILFSLFVPTACRRLLLVMSHWHFLNTRMFGVWILKLKSLSSVCDSWETYVGCQSLCKHPHAKLYGSGCSGLLTTVHAGLCAIEAVQQGLPLMLSSSGHQYSSGPTKLMVPAVLRGIGELAGLSSPFVSSSGPVFSSPLYFLERVLAPCTSLFASWYAVCTS